MSLLSSLSRSHLSARLLLGGTLLAGLPLSAQQPDLAVAAAPVKSEELVRSLLARMEELERRVKQQDEEIARLKTRVTGQPVETGALSRDSGGRTGSGPAENVSDTAVGAAPAVEGDSLVTADDWREPSAPTLTLRGFGDVNYRWDRGRQRHNSFALGQLDLLITSRITEDVNLLNETVFEMDHNGETEVDVERLLIKYSVSDYLNVSAGRYHSAIGFYNTAYHHGTWFQTATGRPLPMRAEDGGGILPMHNVGLSLSGEIPSGSVGLRYVFEIGNGRDFMHGGVQHGEDLNRDKAYNLAIVARPEVLNGAQAGVSVYRDRVNGPTSGFDQEILAFHLVYQRPEFEWLNEYFVVRNSEDRTGRRYRSTGYYTQIARSFGSFRPYFRFQYLDTPHDDPLLMGIHRGKVFGPSFGLRYELADFTALKFQHDHLSYEGEASTDDYTVQWTFTF